MIVAAIVVVALLALGGFFFLNKNNTAMQTPSMEEKQEESNVISSIQDAIMNNMSLECTYTSPEGTNVKAYIKSGKVRSEISGKTAAESSNAIIMDKKMYFWNAQGGFVMTIPEITPGATNPTPNQGQSTLDSLEQYKSSCKQANVSDSVFELPANVKFQDMSKMMPSGVMAPSGSQTAPTGVSQQQIEEMMKKYQNSAQ